MHSPDAGPSLDSAERQARELRARIARTTGRDPDDNLAARRDYAEHKLARYIEATVAAAPPLTDEQRQRLRDLLDGTTTHPTAAVR